MDHHDGLPVAFDLESLGFTLFAHKHKTTSVGAGQHPSDALVSLLGSGSFPIFYPVAVIALTSLLGPFSHKYSSS